MGFVQLSFEHWFCSHDIYSWFYIDILGAMIFYIGLALVVINLILMSITAASFANQEDI